MAEIAQVCVQPAVIEATPFGGAALDARLPPPACNDAALSLIATPVGTINARVAINPRRARHLDASILDMASTFPADATRQAVSDPVTGQPTSFNGNRLVAIAHCASISHESRRTRRLESAGTHHGVCDTNTGSVRSRRSPLAQPTAASSPPSRPPIPSPQIHLRVRLRPSPSKAASSRPNARRGQRQLHRISE